MMGNSRPLSFAKIGRNDPRDMYKMQYTSRGYAPLSLDELRPAMEMIYMDQETGILTLDPFGFEDWLERTGNV